MTALDDLARRFDRSAVEALAKAERDDNTTDPDASNLRHFWTRGEGAAVIEWDTPGALDRCEVLLSKYPITAATLCRSYFKDVHGHNRYTEDEVKPEGADESATDEADNEAPATEPDDDTHDDEDDDEPEPQRDTRSRRERERDARRGRTRGGRGKSDELPDLRRHELVGGPRRAGGQHDGPDSGSTLERGDMAMNHKGIDVGKVKAGPADNLAEGEFIAYASVFGNVDSYGDVVQRGAFTKSIAKWSASGNTVPILYGHDSKNPHMNVGGVVSMVEDERGLKVHGRLDLDTETGEQVYRLVKGRRLSQLSFAYDEVRTRPVKGDPRLGSYKSLDELHVHEVSLVPVGANRETSVVAVKAPATGPSVKAWDDYFTAAKFAPVPVPS